MIKFKKPLRETIEGGDSHPIKGGELKKEISLNDSLTLRRIDAILLLAFGSIGGFFIGYILARVSLHN